MDRFGNFNSAKESQRNYLVRLSNVLASYGIFAFFLGVIFSILPLTIFVSVGIYAVLIFAITLVLVAITLGIGASLIFEDTIVPLWISIGDLNTLLNRTQEISRIGTPIILGISIGFLTISIVLYVIFEDRRKTSKITARSVYLGFGIYFLLSFVLGLFGLGS